MNFISAFCFGYLIYQGLQLGQHILNFVDFEKKQYNCHSPSSIVLHVISPIYAFYQLFITFKYSNVSNFTFCMFSQIRAMNSIASIIFSNQLSNAFMFMFQLLLEYNDFFQFLCRNKYFQYRYLKNKTLWQIPSMRCQLCTAVRQ